VPVDHSLVLDNPWLVAAISLGGGGFAGLISGSFGDLGFLTKLIIAAGTALIIFATIYFFAPAPGA
jgi:hypothetical protein